MRLTPKEPWSCYSHLFGALLAVAALVVLILESAGDPRLTVGFSIYGATLVLLYSASALYHGLHVSPRGEDLLRRFDHSAIFLLIAGSYTPICLVTLQGGWGWTLFAVVWSVALAGIVLKVFFDHLPPWISSLIYVGMGWLAVLAVGPLIQSLPVDGLAWLVGGGLLYTAGAVIYAIERPDPLPDVFGSHEVFHIFVLGGSALHFRFMLGYVG